MKILPCFVFFDKLYMVKIMRKRKQKNQRKVIIIASLCLLFVMTVGYAAFNTNLNITAKGNVLEKGITASELKNSITDADGLYEDNTEEGKYIYKGSNPNNYITFNNETWRIISIEKDNTLKIIRNESIGNMVYDVGYTSNIAGITDSNSVEGTRYTNASTDYCYQNSGTESNYNGCKVWGSNTTMLNSSEGNITKMPRQEDNSTYDLPKEEAYLNIYLNGTWYNELDKNSKTLIDNHTWNAGLLKNQSGQTIETDMQQEKAYKWKGKVGLINPTDYVKTNTNQTLCGTVYNNNTTNMDTCKTTTWLFNSNSYWTMNGYSTASSYYVWYVTSNGNISDYNSSYTYGVRPVVYLSSNVHLKGKGTSDAPFKIIEEKE